MPRTIVVGDVHGCAQELDDLLRACSYRAGDDVVFVGDLVAKGPDSRGVLARYRELGARGVRGNHDGHVLRWADALDRGRSAPHLARTHAEVAAALDERDWAVLRSLRLWLRLPGDDALVVHGGFVPGVPLERQDPRLVMNLRTVRSDGTGSAGADDGRLWGTAWRGPELVLFGHHARAGLQHHAYAIGLDTGCVYGGRLTACILPGRTIVSVPARRAWAPVEDGPVHSAPRTTQDWELAGTEGAAEPQPLPPTPAAPAPTTHVPVRIHAEGWEALAPSEARAVQLAPGPRGSPRQAVLVRDAQGTLHAYLNLCLHMPIPIDAFTGSFFSSDRAHLLCRTHGASYRPEDGLCTAGPCAGKSLVRLTLARDDEGLWILDPG